MAELTKQEREYLVSLLKNVQTWHMQGKIPPLSFDEVQLWWQVLAKLEQGGQLLSPDFFEKIEALNEYVGCSNPVCDHIIRKPDAYTRYLGPIYCSRECNDYGKEHGVDRFYTSAE